MEFGKVPEKELDHIDFKLIAEPKRNQSTLPGEKITQPDIYVGCAKWGRKEWVGMIYPKGTKDANFLEHYVHQFNSIELNATHYQVYGADTIGKWAAKAKGLDFKFCPKVPQAISHYSGFTKAEAITTSFLDGILAFKEHLGPVFLQVSERYSPAKRDIFFNYLATLPHDLQFFIEVRHPDWFADKVIHKELFDTLEKLKMGAVITDTAGRRDCVHMELTIPKAFIRFVGNSLHPTDYTRIDEWVKRINAWIKKGMEETYFFMHMPDEALSPKLAAYVIDKINATCKMHLQNPKFLQNELF